MRITLTAEQSAELKRLRRQWRDLGSPRLMIHAGGAHGEFCRDFAKLLAEIINVEPPRRPVGRPSKKSGGYSDFELAVKVTAAHAQLTQALREQGAKYQREHGSPMPSGKLFREVRRLVQELTADRTLQPRTCSGCLRSRQPAGVDNPSARACPRCGVSLDKAPLVATGRSAAEVADSVVAWQLGVSQRRVRQIRRTPSPLPWAAAFFGA